MNRLTEALGNRSVVLVGLMGAGKTSVGRRLSHYLGLPFTDADQEIESAAGCTIADFFETYGEPAFRDGEEKVIDRLLNNGPQILSTGGGAFMSHKTRKRIAERGVSVWLRADINVLIRRTGRRNDRPLLRGKNAAETLKRLVAERHPVYAGADITVETGTESVDNTAKLVLRSLASFLGVSADDLP